MSTPPLNPDAMSADSRDEVDDDSGSEFDSNAEASSESGEDEDADAAVDVNEDDRGAFSQSARLRAKAALSDTEVRDALRALGVSEAEVDVCRDRAELMELFDAVTSMEAIGREGQQSSAPPLPEL